MEIGNKVKCPYGLTGVVEGFHSPDIAIIKVKIKEYSKGKKARIKEVNRVHIYPVNELEVIE